MSNLQGAYNKVLVLLHEIEDKDNFLKQIRKPKLSDKALLALNDLFYPKVLSCKGKDYSQSLQILVKSIAFKDPISGKLQSFTSEQELFLP